MSTCADLSDFRFVFALFEDVDSWVIIRWHQEDFVWHFNELRDIYSLLVSCAKLSVSATAPSIELIIFGDS